MDFLIADTFTDSLARLTGNKPTAVKVINHLGDEVVKVLEVAWCDCYKLRQNSNL